MICDFILLVDFDRLDIRQLIRVVLKLDSNEYRRIRFRKMAKLLDGKALAEKINSELKNEIEQWIVKNQRPRLVCILVGNDPASAKYVENKKKASEFVGKIYFINCNTYM